jgi:prepilin-type N-terminal cleavage/methylation domain-containing protein
VNTARKRIQGFTLIELMIVVAIIGILSSIAIPQFATSLSRTKEKARIANKEIVKQALYQYFSSSLRWPTTSATAWACICPAAQSCWGYPSLLTLGASNPNLADLSNYLPNPPTMNVPSYVSGYNYVLYSDQWVGKAVVWPMEPNSPDSDCLANALAGSFIALDPGGYRECYESFAL